MACAVPASASTIFYQDLGTSAAPSALGGYDVATFPVDLANDPGDSVTTVLWPEGGSLSFSSPLTDASVGDGWNTWSHPYGGDVYFGPLNSLTLTLPDGISAFYFYLEPDLYDPATGTGFDVSAFDGTGSVVASALAVNIEGFEGARGFGFYSPDTTIKTITIAGGVETQGFGIGEFGTVSPVPEPATLTLLATGLAGVFARRRRRAKLDAAHRTV